MLYIKTTYETLVKEKKEKYNNLLKLYLPQNWYEYASKYWRDSRIWMILWNIFKILLN